MSFTTIIIGLFMFMFLVTIHEAGHFTIAKLSGIKVDEFSIGMGPMLFNKQIGETKYSIRALPIGGYVMMDGEEEESNDERSFGNAPAWKRFLTIFAGPGVNLLFAIIVFYILASMNGVPTTSISSVQANSPAYTAGILKGDKIVSINENKISTFSEINYNISISKDDIKLKVLRGNESKEFNIRPVEVNGKKVIGVLPVIKNDFLTNISYAFNMTIFIMKMIWESLKGLFTGVLGLDKLSGPVGVIKQVGVSLNMGFGVFLSFVAMISVNLGFFNLVPIPALDGSKLFFILIEMIIRRPINKKIEQTISIIGFILLLALIFIVTIKDIIVLF